MKEVTCCLCGAQGLETPDDPCPGHCPLCLEKALIVAFGEQGIPFTADVEQRKVIARKLRSIGVADWYIDAVIFQEDWLIDVAVSS
jgi:hypothetical protein